VRALGPALGMSGSLTNPSLIVFEGSQPKGSNQNWSGADVVAAAAGAGLMPLPAGSTDAALLLTCAPGAYSVQVTDAGNPTGLVLCEVALVDGRAPTVAPALLNVPGAVSATEGGSLTLAAPNLGKPTPTYQWNKGGTPIPGATRLSYTIPGVTVADSGSYTVTLANSVASVVSQPWLVTVSGQGPVPPAITTQPSDRQVQIGETALFNVTATGPGPLTFEWRKNGVPIPGDVSTFYAVNSLAQNSTLSVLNTSAQSAGVYSVVVRNANGSVTSRGATLTVTPPHVAPVISVHPGNLLVAVGDSAEFRITASGIPEPLYQWFKNGQPIAGATSTAHIVARATTFDAGGYFAVVTNAAGSAMSRTATLSVSTTPVAPTIGTQPAAIAVLPGFPARFEVTASGTAPLSFQWRKETTPIPGATNASYIIPAASFDDSAT
jgi:hypothetical protein